MKATFFTLFAAAGMVAAQNLDAIPSCACVMEALPDAGCEGVDIQCACKNINKIMASASDCLQDACDPEELEQAQGGATELCGGEEIPSISSSSSDDNLTILLA
ncbi:hypothetical protein ACRE_021570 [Hapsidospora chrysogenum ATCC 11550]|uniref:CFEM domain-containing protein n=1 Tax=Hapsidospora chrysogenum (strain ATCC 11550 / CBS 779.69 / DSM 880 / IAM 14645 / JCM 23072 / IMI 49137) TaxID=857340 RepID=A0A086TC99_HAPC1|nr:hypothetical protein ACRE_021570 [Hapsidospora chrysogenum ATCC 11550]